MTVQEHIILTSRNVADEFFKYMEEFPEDKLNWKPLDSGQSALSMAREIGITPTWAMMAMSDKPFGEEKADADKDSWKTIAECKAQYDQRFEKWAAFVRSLSEEDLKKTKFLPFNGGRDHTFLELLEYPRWNTTWHLGQIAYIQTLYGDKDMYWA